jgi:hypothetical protein
MRGILREFKLQLIRAILLAAGFGMFSYILAKSI